MPPRWPTRAHALRRALTPIARTPLARRLASAQEGSFLIETLASALIIVIVGLGVLESIDRSSRLGGEQEAQAVAGNFAQSEQEQVRALSLAEQSAMRRTSTYDVEGERYTVTSRGDWVSDGSGAAGCTTASANADYIKLTTVVTWRNIGMRKPVTLESLIAPGVRSFGAGQGSLGVQVTDRNGDPVVGLPLSLSGTATRSDSTSTSGCVLWGFLTAGSGYTLGFSRPPDHVTADGQQAVSMPLTVVGEQTSNVALQYDRGGYLTTRFVTRDTAGGPDIDTFPQFARVTHSGGGGVSVSWPVSGSSTTSPLLFPFTSAYTVQPDTCSASDTPPVPEEPNPTSPAAPSPVVGLVTPGITTTTAEPVRLPSPNILVVDGSTPISGATVRVVTGCGTTYRRITRADGMLADPGFPYSSALTVCAASGDRKVQAVSTNRNFNNSAPMIMDIGTSTTSGTCGG